jgi:hypothetical protein
MQISREYKILFFSLLEPSLGKSIFTILGTKLETGKHSKVHHSIEKT